MHVPIVVAPCAICPPALAPVPLRHDSDRPVPYSVVGKDHDKHINKELVNLVVASLEELGLLVFEGFLGRFPIVDRLELRVLLVVNRLALLFITDQPVLGYKS